MRNISTLNIFILSATLSTGLFAQSYNPVVVSGFNCDVIAEAPAITVTTSIGMDLLNNVMYTQTMAAFLGISGGLVDNGTIINGTNTYQLASYVGNCALHVPIGSTLAFTVSTPAQYAKISILILSTELYSNVNITTGYTDGTTHNFGSFQVQDWFGGTGSVYCCFGRIVRASGPPTMSGYPTDPRMYVVDLTLPCPDMKKNLQTISFHTTSGGSSNSSIFALAVSAIPYSQNVIPAITDVTCNGGNNGSIALNVTGSNAPYTYSWNTAPVQTNATATGLQSGTYICTISDVNGCTSKDTAIVAQPAPIVVTASATHDTICSGDSVQLSVSGLTALTWNPGGLTTSPATVFPVNTTTYTVTGTDGNGCSGTDSITIFVDPGAAVTITPNPATICKGDSVPLQASGAQNYTWIPAAGLSSNSVANPNASPSLTTIYTITGTNAGGCSSVTTLTVTVNPVVSINPVATPAAICAGDSTVLSASGLVTYNWNPGGQTTSSITVAPVVTTLYTISGIDANGCNATDSINVTVYPVPVVSVSPASPAFCDGDSVLLQASGASSFSWSPANGLSNTSASNPWAHSSSTTTYTATGTDSHGCTTVTTVTVTVNPLPNVTATANPALVCAGDSTQLTTNGLTNFTWNPGGQTVSVINLSPASTTTYTVTGTDANGCSGSATVSVTVDVVPVVNVAASATLICKGASVDLSVSGNALNYSWNPGGLSGDTISIAPAATTTYTVTGASAANCKATDTITIIVVPYPQAAFTPSAINGCDPVSISFTNQSSNATLWQWLYSDGDSSFQQNPAHTFTSGTWDVTLIAANASGCADTLVKPALITVYPYPQAAFTPSVINGCEPLTVSFTDQSLNNPASWNWQFGNGNASSSQNPSHTFAHGTYDVTLIAANAIGCTDTLVQTALITVYPKPKPAFTVTPFFNTPIEVNEATFNFTDMSSGAVNYLWNFGDTVTSQLINPIHVYTATGNYEVTLVVTSTNGCIDSITKGVIEIFQNNFLVIPSCFTPNGDGLNDVFIIPPNPNIKKATLAIYNRWGQIIFSADDKNKGWDGSFLGEPEQQGVYIYRAKVTFLNGQQAEKTGHVTLMR